jgi:hypothetical protein
MCDPVSLTILYSTATFMGSGVGGVTGESGETQATHRMLDSAPAQKKIEIFLMITDIR